MQRKSVLIIIGLCFSLTCGNQALANAAPGKQQPAVQEILSRVAETLGGEDKLKKIRSISISLNFRHAPPHGAQMELKGKNEYYFASHPAFARLCHHYLRGGNFHSGRACRPGGL